MKTVLRRVRVLVLALAVLLTLGPIGGAFAQTGGEPDSAATMPTAGAGWVADVEKFLANQSLAVLFAVAVGLAYKFWPAARNLSNDWLRIVTALAAWSIHVFGPAPAYASPLGDIGRGIGGLMLPVVWGFADSWIASKVFEGWLRQPTDKWHKPLPDPKPRK